MFEIWTISSSVMFINTQFSTISFGKGCKITRHRHVSHSLNVSFFLIKNAFLALRQEWTWACSMGYLLGAKIRSALVFQEGATLLALLTVTKKKRRRKEGGSRGLWKIDRVRYLTFKSWEREREAGHASAVHQITRTRKRAQGFNGLAT